jgi:hypothetical protein
MAKARSMAVKRYILKQDRELPPEEQTVFLIQPMSSEFQAKLDDQTVPVEGAVYELETKDNKVKMPLTVQAAAQKDIQKLKESLVGWENLKTEDGQDVKFDKATATDMLYVEWRDELCTFIDSLNYMTEDEVKN